MASDKEIAEFFRLCLQLGICDHSAVQRWADTIIDRELHPAYPIVDLAVSRGYRTFDIMELLAEVRGAVREFHPPRLVLAFLRRRLIKHPNQIDAAVRTMYELSRSGQLSLDEECDISVLDDMWCFVREGISGPYRDAESAGREVVDFLQSYADLEEQLPEMS